MATFSALKSEIEFDLADSALSSQVEQAVLDAIEHHGAERFWFNETRSYTFTTTNADDTYTLSASSPVHEFVTIDKVEASIGGIYRDLERVTAEDMQVLKQGSTTGQPWAWSYFGDEIQLHPTPNAAYTVRVHGHYRLTPLSADSDSNAWTSAARNLIRATAKKFIFARLRRNTGMAQLSQQDEMLELQRLREETSRRTAAGRIQPWC